MKAERIVCDSNVLISAAIVPSGKARKVVDYAIDHARLLITRELFDEFSSRLARPKFDRYLSVEDRAEFVQLITFIGSWVSIPGTLQICRDPDDDKIIETAIVGRADCLVTGDADILALRPAGEAGQVMNEADAMFRGVALLRPAEFLQLIAAS
jgi:uncharacterized protein